MFKASVSPSASASLFFTSIILMALGIIGEYIGFLNYRSLNLPLVIEKERYNFPNKIE